MKVFTVLIADDEKDYLNIVSKILSSWGYDVIPVTNGKAAVEAVSNKKCDVAILDYLMPEMDGVETFKAIREINDSIPVIISTAYPDNRSIEGAEALGVFAYIPKSSVFTDPKTSLKAILEVVEKKLAG